MKFFKMHGSGNDFILFLISDKEQRIFTRRLIAGLCRRAFGIGADGLILGLPAKNKDHDFRMRIFNADGSEAEMCGNGIRCLGKLVYDEKLSHKTNLIIKTISGDIPIKLQTKNGKDVKVSVTLPTPSSVTRISGSKFKVLMGNPHYVVMINQPPKTFPVPKYGPLLERHHLFPGKTNVEFVMIKNRCKIEMRVWERGVGETQSCGTGACAAVMAGISAGQLNTNNIQVKLPGGILTVSRIKNNMVVLTGPAEMVFAGNTTLD